MHTQDILISAVLPILLCFLLWRLGGKVHNRAPAAAPPPPEAGGSLPLLGHLHLLGGPPPLHITLSVMAERLGPIFTVRMGLKRILVVSSWELARECFTTHDKVFADRPKSLAAEILGYNYANFTLGPYGPYWRWGRKTLTLGLLSAHRFTMLGHVRESEIRSSVKELHELAWSGKGNKVEMKSWFRSAMYNLLLKLVAGKSYQDIMPQNSTLEDYITLFGKFVVSDVFPFLKWLDVGGYGKAMKKTVKEMDRILERWIEEHKERRKLDLGEGIEEGQDFMDMVLSSPNIGDGEDFHGHDADTSLKALCMILILAGADTTTLTLTWALSLMLNNKETIRKAQKELDLQVGRDRKVNESDIKNLPYLQAVIKETLRLYPPAPLALPHESREDCIVAGYHIPTGTQLFVNLEKLHRDPQVWSDPEEFKPDRFFTDRYRDFDVRGQNFELLPFGAGRRMCQGVTLAMQASMLVLASLVHCFEIDTPSCEPVDMTEGGGLVNPKATPLEVHLTARLSHGIYG